jgi:hypothetical protein
MAQVKQTIKIPTEYNQRTARAIANDLVEFIVDRTKEGKGKDGRRFPKYSKSYMDSLDFEIAGKDSTVDLTLTGEMLDTLQVLSAQRGEIVIGFPEGSDVNGRAEGNILGSYGGDPNPSRARNFLDVSDKEISRIAAQYPLDNIQERLRNLDTTELARILAREVSSSLEFEDEGE